MVDIPLMRTTPPTVFKWVVVGVVLRCRCGCVWGVPEPANLLQNTLPLNHTTGTLPGSPTAGAMYCDV